MTENVTSELIYTVLKQLQGSLVILKDEVIDMKQQLISVRDQLHTMDGNILRLEKHAATTNHRLDRIERQLDLTTA